MIGVMTKDYSIKQYCREQVARRINENYYRIEGPISFYETDYSNEIETLYNGVFPLPSLKSKIIKAKEAEEKIATILKSIINTDEFEITCKIDKISTRTIIEYTNAKLFIRNPVNVSAVLLCSRMANRYIYTLSNLDDILYIDLYGPILSMIPSYIYSNIRGFYNSRGTDGNAGIVEFMKYVDGTLYGEWYNYTNKRTQADHNHREVFYLRKENNQYYVYLQLPTIGRKTKEIIGRASTLIKKINKSGVLDISISPQNNKTYNGYVEYIEYIIKCNNKDITIPGKVPDKFIGKKGDRNPYYNLIKAIHLIATAEASIRTVNIDKIAGA